jgi:hypothetical protein
LEIVDCTILILLGASIAYLLDEIFGVTARIRLWLEEW